MAQPARFLVAGAINTVVGYLVFSALYLLLRRHIHYLGIGVVSQAIALTSAFIVYRRLVFVSTDPWLPSFLRFNLSQLIAFSLGLAGLYGLVHFAQIAPLAAQAIVILCTVIVSYALHRYYSFRRGPIKVLG